MAGSSSPMSLGAFRRDISWHVVASYALDWIVLLIFGFIALGIGMITPNKRPFSLDDPNISFPYAEHSTVPSWLLLVLNALVPVILIFLVTILLVPGATVPKDTPRTLIWKRKLWELHTGWLGLGLSLVLAWFFTQGMKNMFGKPRPDLLARCQPDLENAANYIVGGVGGENILGRLYSADICQNPDKARVDDGFRSYPSGHSSSAAAGLVYLSLFLASKLAVTIPFAPSSTAPSAASQSAFPSRNPASSHVPLQPEDDVDNYSLSSQPGPAKSRNAMHNETIQSVRRQAAAPPLYLLVLILIPFGTSVFIAASRWWDFRHHGFDILFGWLMGFASSIYSFRYYHQSIQEGAGWAWGPRSHDRAFWAGVGRVGYAGDSAIVSKTPSNHQATVSNDIDLQAQPPQAYQGFISQRQNHAVVANEGYHPRPIHARAYGEGPFTDVEMERMDSRV